MADPRILPKFNRCSYDIVRNSEGKLLEPQSEALRRLQEFFQKQSGLIGLVSMPTGSGKSGVISCLPYFLGALGLHPPPGENAFPFGTPVHRFDKPVLVIAPDLRILKQLGDGLTISPDAQGKNFLRKTGIVSSDTEYLLPTGRKIEETKHVRNPEFLRNNEIIVANAQKFLHTKSMQTKWEDALPDDIFKLVIVDEAHHHPASTWRRIVQKFRYHAMVVFLTATPFRGDGKRVLTADEGKTVYELSLKDAREMRIIREIKWDPIKGQDADLTIIFTRILDRVKSIQQEKDKEHPLPDNIPHMAIAITPNNIAYAEQVAWIWNQRWSDHGSAIAYHSDVPKKPKEAMMEALLSNNVKLVVIVKKLLEGFDHPPISIAAIMTKIKSRVKFAQFLGRAQRVVRGEKGLESKDIVAHVVTHSFFEQEDNYRAYENAHLIEPDLDE